MTLDLTSLNQGLRRSVGRGAQVKDPGYEVDLRGHISPAYDVKNLLLKKGFASSSYRIETRIYKIAIPQRDKH